MTNRIQINLTSEQAAAVLWLLSAIERQGPGVDVWLAPGADTDSGEVVDADAHYPLLADAHDAMKLQLTAEVIAAAGAL